MRVNALQRHMQAMMAPSSIEEKAITSIVNGLDAYVQLLRKREKHMPPEEHTQLMAAVVSATRSALSLTKGPLGRLDPGLLRHKMGEIAGIDFDASTVVPLHDLKNDLALAVQPPGQARDRAPDHQGVELTVGRNS